MTMATGIFPSMPPSVRQPLSFCYHGHLDVDCKDHVFHIEAKRITQPEVFFMCLCGFTCTAWTWGDWITDGCAAWMTPWTWTVCPLGSCTSVTVGPVAVAWPVVMDTWNSAVMWPFCLSRALSLFWTHLRHKYLVFSKISGKLLHSMNSTTD